MEHVTIKLDGNGEVEILWGDGSSDIFTIDGIHSIEHTYPDTGIYNIKIRSKKQAIRYIMVVDNDYNEYPKLALRDNFIDETGLEVQGFGFYNKIGQQYIHSFGEPVIDIFV